MSEPGKIAWIDLTVPDAEAIRDFYQHVAGWDPSPVAMGDYEDYCMTPSGAAQPVAGICHARGYNEDLPPAWLIYITVGDLDEAMRRAERYIRAGADGIFIEAPRSIAELERIGKAFDVPQICNPLMGGHTPILSMEELGQLGFNCAVLGLDTIMHAAKAIETVLVDMKSGKFAHRNDGMDFEDYKKLVGYDKWESIDERFAPKP